ncbi:MAG: ribonuclease T2 [Rhizobiaceae bacterium]|jgi:ribonuclease T2|nr:ribonuclease T2 [Rhizobiaceae bacterium]
MRNRNKLSVPAVLVIAGVTALLTWYADRMQGDPRDGTRHPAPNMTDAGAFDFYVLALSWSPTWCEEQPDDGEGEAQCSTARPYAFVLHGLWPQHERGWPEFCDSDHGTRIDRRIADDMLDIMPSRDLVFHQWRKHGSCSGLAPDAFFDLARDAHDRITIPPGFDAVADYRSIEPRAVEQAFIEANDGLQQNAIAVTCSRRYLREVRICMNRDLTFRACPEVDANACRERRTILPPVRQ